MSRFHCYVAQVEWRSQDPLPGDAVPIGDGESFIIFAFVPKSVGSAFLPTDVDTYFSSNQAGKSFPVLFRWTPFGVVDAGEINSYQSENVLKDAFRTRGYTTVSFDRRPSSQMERRQARRSFRAFMNKVTAESLSFLRNNVEKNDKSILFKFKYNLELPILVRIKGHQHVFSQAIADLVSVTRLDTVQETVRVCVNRYKQMESEGKPANEMPDRIFSLWRPHDLRESVYGSYMKCGSLLLARKTKPFEGNGSKLVPILLPLAYPTDDPDLFDL